MPSAAIIVAECVLLLAAALRSNGTRDSSLLVREPRNTGSELESGGGGNYTVSPDCPPWYLPASNAMQNDLSPQCYCADTLKNIVQCNSRSMSSFIALTYCMTLDDSTDMVLVGACPYSAIPSNTSIDGIWIPLPPRVSEINNASCAPLHRVGLLCGECDRENGYGISVHSADYGCVQCSHHPYGWVLLVFTQLLPQTIFFLIIFFFRISLTTAKLNGFLLVCQIISSTYIERTLPDYIEAIGYPAFRNLAKVVLVFYDFWVLDFFTSVLPRACFHEGINTLQAVTLSYVSAFFPFFLILCTFILVRLIDCNYRPVAFVLAPYKKLHFKLSKHIDLHRSLIHTFSGVIVLSYSKLALVSYSLLFPTSLYNASGVQVYNARWYHNAAIELFGAQHLPYGILAIFILLSFVVAPPLILVLYPFKWFRWLLHKVRLDRPGLNAFMDSFQGCYRDGTENNQDLRYFAAFYFFLRLLFITTRLFTMYYLQFYVIVLILVSATIVFSFFKPYKKNVYNIIDVCFLCFLSSEFFLYIVFSWLTAFTQTSTRSQLPTALVILMILLSLFPLVYFFVLVMLELLISVKVFNRAIKSCTDFLHRHRPRKDSHESFPLSEWPRRLLENEGSVSMQTYGDSIKY